MHDSAAVATGLKAKHEIVLRVSTAVLTTTVAETKTNTK